jgi:hypothetical protein
LFNSFKSSCCLNATIIAEYEDFSSGINTHHKAIIASHSYLFINHFSSKIRFDISQRNSLKNATNSSTFIFSDMLVNHSISEKYIVTLFISQSRFIVQLLETISSAMALETYSDKALLSLILSLFSSKYFMIFEIDKDSKIAKNS